MQNGDSIDPTTPLETRFGVGLRELRLEAGLTQTELAAEATSRGMKIDPTAITRIEKGQRSLRLNEAALLAQCVGSSLYPLLQKVDPGAHIDSLRDRANEAMRDARHQMFLWLMALHSVRSALRDAPGSIAPGVTPENYYDWVLTRLNALYGPQERHIRADSDEEYEAFSRLTASLARNVIGPYEPDEDEDDEETAGRGLGKGHGELLN